MATFAGPDFGAGAGPIIFEFGSSFKARGGHASGRPKGISATQVRRKVSARWHAPSR